MIVRLTGHADVLAIQGRTARGLDFKSGRRDGDYSQQMRAYCTLVLLGDSDLEEVSFTVMWLRTGEAETYVMRREQLPVWLEELRSKVLAWDGVFRPGEWCGFCSRSHECEARNAMIRRDVSAFLETTVMSEAMVPAAMITMARRAKQVAKAAADVLAIIKDHVERNGELVDDSIVLGIVETPQRKLDVGKAWPVLEEAGFVDEDFVQAVTLSVGKVEKRVAEKAGKGKGAAAIRALGEKLDAAGAVVVQTKRELKETRR